jgi:hypothetical protein
VSDDRSPREEGAAAEEGDAEADAATPDALSPEEGADIPVDIGDVDATVNATTTVPEGDAEAAAAAESAADARDSGKGTYLTSNAFCTSTALDARLPLYCVWLLSHLTRHIQQSQALVCC